MCNALFGDDFATSTFFLAALNGTFLNEQLVNMWHSTRQATLQCAWATSRDVVSYIVDVLSRGFSTWAE